MKTDWPGQTARGHASCWDHRRAQTCGGARAVQAAFEDALSGQPPYTAAAEAILSALKRAEDVRFCSAAVDEFLVRYRSAAVHQLVVGSGPDSDPHNGRAPLPRPPSQSRLAAAYETARPSPRRS